MVRIVAPHYRFRAISRNSTIVRHLTMTAPSISGDRSLGPVFFWREFEEPYGFMSQWYESAFEVNGVTYLTAEMWMMVQKAKLFGDEVSVQTPISYARDPTLMHCS